MGKFFFFFLVVFFGVGVVAVVVVVVVAVCVLLRLIIWPWFFLFVIVRMYRLNPAFVASLPFRAVRFFLPPTCMVPYYFNVKLFPSLTRKF